ncbi:MAG: HPr kinase [Solirubrobacterales bacterium]|nr:HPr kinase [Solirubrobacterales bacterium]
MGLNQSAFGLDLRASFPLPGLPEIKTSGLPEVSLDVRSVPELRRIWSGPLTGGRWRGTLRDGAELSIEWGREGDLLFGYGDSAWYRLDPAGAELICASEEEDALGWQRVLLSRVLPIVALARGYEALHAAAVEVQGAVVALVGASGAGKSTLAAELMRRGHRLFTDDVLVFGRTGNEVLAHPAPPHISLEEGEGDGFGEPLGTVGGKTWVALREAASGPLPVSAVAVLERGREGSPRAEQLTSSPLPLAPFMLGLPDERDRDGERFNLYSDLIEGALLLRLAGSPQAPVEAFAGELERVVEAATLAPLGESG